MTIYTGRQLAAALTAQGCPLNYSTLLQDVLPMMLAVGAAQKPGHDYAVTDEGLAALLDYLRGRQWFDVTYAKHEPFMWRAVFNLLPAPRPWETNGPAWLQAQAQD